MVLEEKLPLFRSGSYGKSNFHFAPHGVEVTFSLQDHKFHEKSSLQEKDTGCILATYFCDLQVTRASAETEGFVSGIFVTFFVFTRPVRRVQRTFPCEDDRRETFEGGEYD